MMVFMFNIGEIYMLFVFVFGFGFYVLLMRLWIWLVFIGGVIGVVGVVGFLFINFYMVFCFLFDVLCCFFWRLESDYYDFWMGGLNIGLYNLLIGVGVDNFDFYCV